ncbi:MAG: asparagine synthase (glutamine-hydrolyzing) [Mucilaginibacter sp.]
MCRIVGIFSSNTPVSKLLDIGDVMRDELAYGGPDDKGNYTDDGLYLGHRRLSIIDVSKGGHQPMQFNEWVITFNGEIYNYKEIAAQLEERGYTFVSNSDTEVILKAFDCWSYACIEKFRGMFAFALWNKHAKKMLLCRDRVGVKPLFWYKDDDVFLFSSELKAMRKYPSFNTEIDDEAVSLFLQTGYIPQTHCIYKYARKLQPGSFLEIDETGNFKTWKYWDVNDITVDNYTNFSEEELIQKTEELVTESCRLRMVADVPVGVFLSGGIDSSLITTVLQKANSSQIKTYTIGFEDAIYDESVQAKKVADYLGTDHYEYKCTEADFLDVIEELPYMYDEPFGDSSAIPTHLVSKMARQQVTVALSADGGDEVFGGYDRYLLTYKVYSKLRFLPAYLKKGIAATIQKLDAEKIAKLSGSLLFNQLRGLEWRLPKFANVLQATGLFDFYSKSSSNIPLSLLAQLHSASQVPLFVGGEKYADNGFYSLLGKADIATYLEGDILTKVDRATMQVALEGREPLLDHKIIEFGLSLPDHYKIRANKGKWILRQVLYKHLPAEFIDRPKQGFAIPVKKWLHQNLKSYIDGMIHDQAFLKLFKFDQIVLQQIVRSFNEKKNNTVNPYFIWSMYSLYCWYLTWMKNS